MKQQFICDGCGKTYSGIRYTDRRDDGSVIRICFKCSDKSIKQRNERERLQAWNAWAKQ